MYREISPRELADRLARHEPVYLVDVRQPWEHQTARLEGSTLVPLPELQARAHEIAPPDGALVVTYCHHGIRSRTAAAVIAQMGVAEVASLTGGIDAWSVEIDPAVPRY